MDMFLEYRVQRAMMVPNLNHRDPWFGKWLVQLQADTRLIYNTDQVRALHPLVLGFLLGQSLVKQTPTTTTNSAVILKR